MNSPQAHYNNAFEPTETAHSSINMANNQNCKPSLNTINRLGSKFILLNSLYICVLFE